MHRNWGLWSKPNQEYMIFSVVNWQQDAYFHFPVHLSCFGGIGNYFVFIFSGLSLVVWKRGLGFQFHFLVALYIYMKLEFGSCQMEMGPWIKLDCSIRLLCKIFNKRTLFTVFGGRLQFVASCWLWCANGMRD